MKIGVFVIGVVIAGAFIEEVFSMSPSAQQVSQEGTEPTWTAAGRGLCHVVELQNGPLSTTSPRSTLGIVGAWRAASELSRHSR